MALVNHYAVALGFYGDMVTDAPQNTTPKEILFMRPDRTTVCGKIAYKPSKPMTANSHEDNVNLYKISRIHADAFDAIENRIRDEAIRVAKEFLPPNNIVNPEPTFSNIEYIAEEYQRDIERRLNSSGMEQGKFTILAPVLSLPDAADPDVRTMTNVMPDAGHTYKSYLEWERRRRDVVYGALDPDAP